MIFYTSGTTGKPKGAISTHRGVIANLQNTVFNTVAGSIRDATPDVLSGQDAAAPDAGRHRPARCSPRRCSTCRAATRTWWSASSVGCGW